MNVPRAPAKSLCNFSPLGVLFLLGLLTKRANGAGAIAGIAGSILVQIWIGKS